MLRQRRLARLPMHVSVKASSRATGCYTLFTGLMRRIAIALILVVCIGAPVAETFDRWDHTYQDGNDTEAALVVISLCIGAALSLTGNVIIVAGPGPSVARAFPPRDEANDVVSVRPTHAAPTISPPTPLRV
jgi:hypothetical protein